ncbi:baseplate hub protein [Bordetella sp. 02P26C-1]|uniref:baseplate hub protein n=1 Tax=Bordetella sp. 02P26C-1 TaxID=2683195 RepID=UPI00135277BF|nr:hypothetical protein [Bordetella sp. 02P26C-1]MVW80171.1 hypothetical protein [Bordetella sp. 02P26C-1]
MTTLEKRRIQTTITLGEGQFGEGKGSEVVLSGYRATVLVEQISTDKQASLQMVIYGLPLDMMNRLTCIGPVMSQVRFNGITVTAGTDGAILGTVYQGTITQAWADLSAMPDSKLNIVAQAAYIDAIKPVPASSFKGAVAVDQIMSGLAAQMGLAFENNGVSVKLSNPYFPGTAYDQVRACAKAAGISFIIDRGVLAIWPMNSARAEGPIRVAPDTNLVGFPAFTASGIVLTTFFEPNIAVGKRVEVDSALQVAAGEWIVYNCYHYLESETPGGKWFTQMICQRPYGK